MATMVALPSITRHIFVRRWADLRCGMGLILCKQLLNLSKRTAQCNSDTAAALRHASTTIVSIPYCKDMVEKLS